MVGQLQANGLAVIASSVGPGNTFQEVVPGLGALGLARGRNHA
jgi:hypothetical protein